MNDANTAARGESTRSAPVRLWRIAWPWLFWALWGAWLAASDLHNDDPQPAVLLLFMGAAVLGAARPRAWWAWGIALAAWIPAEPLVSRVTGRAMITPLNPGVLIAFFPALLGAAAGAALRRASQSVRREGA